MHIYEFRGYNTHCSETENLCDVALFINVLLHTCVNEQRWEMEGIPGSVISIHVNTIF
jgi:hypothetical protein